MQLAVFGVLGPVEPQTSPMVLPSAMRCHNDRYRGFAAGPQATRPGEIPPHIPRGLDRLQLACTGSAIAPSVWRNAMHVLPRESSAGEPARGVQHLRVLIANERQDRLAILANVVAGMGHKVVASETSVRDVGPATAKERPDLAIVGLGESHEHALGLISGIVRESFCPVIAVTHTHDPDWVDQVAMRGVYAYVLEGNPDELQSAIEITLRRFADYQTLHRAFDRGNAQALREREFVRVRQRDALALHDGLVQGLAVAQLALRLDRTEQSREALEATLLQAKALVARAVEELAASGISLEQLISDAAGQPI
jgi:AmiR/NasT family two-component response regulator